MNATAKNKNTNDIRKKSAPRAERADVCRGARVPLQMKSSKKIDKKGQNEKTCALACQTETAAVETSSFILRF